MKDIWWTSHVASSQSNKSAAKMADVCCQIAGKILEATDVVVDGKAFFIEL